MKECILKLKDASYSYDGETQAIHNINVEFYQGEKVAILGSNGAGKSTFFLCLNGILPLQAGKIIYSQKEISRQKKDLFLLRKNVGFVFQDPDNQIIAATVEGEISFGLMNINIPKEEISRRITQITKELDLTKYRKSPPHYLSGGEKKRVSIADILVMEPKVLLFDEPTASLDGKNIEVFEEIVKRQSVKGVTTLISTHDIDFAWRWADRIIVFHQGEIQADGLPQEIFKDNKLLEKTWLKPPTIFNVTKIVCESKGIEIPEKVPRTEKEFAKFVEEMKGN